MRNEHVDKQPAWQELQYSRAVAGWHLTDHQPVVAVFGRFIKNQLPFLFPRPA